MNKHAIVKEWVEQYLSGSKIYFENIDTIPGARTLVPDYGDFKLSQDIWGFQRKQYTFGFIACETLDEYDTELNAETRDTIDSFNDWVVEQEKNGNYPNFGENTRNYSVEPLQNMSNMAGTYETENGLVAKYILMCRIEYVEKE